MGLGAVGERRYAPVVQGLAWRWVSFLTDKMDVLCEAGFQKDRGRQSYAPCFDNFFGSVCVIFISCYSCQRLKLVFFFHHINARTGAGNLVR